MIDKIMWYRRFCCAIIIKRTLHCLRGLRSMPEISGGRRTARRVQGQSGAKEVMGLDDRIKAVREALKLSQREFGERLGVSRDVISNIEYGRVQPKELLLRHICELYKVNEHWLNTGEGEMFDTDPEEDRKLKEAIGIFQTLRPEFQDYALEQIKRLAELQEKK